MGMTQKNIINVSLYNMTCFAFINLLINNYQFLSISEILLTLVVSPRTYILIYAIHRVKPPHRVLHIYLL